MNAGGYGIYADMFSSGVFYDTWISLFLWRTGAKKECRQHHDGMRSDYGIVGCHVGIVWIFTVFLVEIMQELLEISGGLDCMELK